MKRRVAIAALACLWAPGAHAQQGTQTTPVFIKNYQPTPSYSQLAVGATSTRVALPAGDTIIVYNTGANAATVAFGDQTVVATAAGDVIQPLSWMAFSRTVFTTYVAGIETAGTTTLVISGGIGSPRGSGGGGGGGSGGGGTNASVSGTGVAVPGSATYTGMNVAGNLTGMLGTAYGLKVDIDPASAFASTLNAGVGTVGSAAPTQGVQVLSKDTSGNSQAIPYDHGGIPAVQAANQTPTNCSGTATTTAANAFAASATLHTFVIQNESSSTNICFSMTGTAVCGAAGTYTLTGLTQSGDHSFTSPGGTNQAVSVIGAASAAFSCTEF